MFRQGPDFNFEISGYYISEVEITRVNCILVAKGAKFYHADNEDFDQTARIRRLN